MSPVDFTVMPPPTSVNICDESSSYEVYTIPKFTRTNSLEDNYDFVLSPSATIYLPKRFLNDNPAFKLLQVKFATTTII